MHLVQVLVEENGDLQKRPRAEPGDAERASAQPEPEAKLAGHALEVLPLARQHVGRHEASRPDEELAGHYLGANLLTHLGGAARTDALFDRAESLAALLGPILRG